MRLFRFIIAALVTALAFVDPAFAEGAEAAAEAGSAGLTALSAGLGIGLAVVGGAIGQSLTASSALDATGRNPGAAGQLFTPMIIALALIESLVLFALAVSLKLLGVW